jgi:hypothetical protein
MIDTLYAVLTDTNTRKPSAVKAHLSQRSSAGSPWFNAERQVTYPCPQQ